MPLRFAYEEGGKGDRLLAKLSRFLGEKIYFLGDDLTYADIAFAWDLVVLESALVASGFENPLERYQNLVELGRRVLALPGVAEFVASEGNQKMPLMVPGKLDWLKELPL